jgi:hypothetical protein
MVIRGGCPSRFRTRRADAPGRESAVLPPNDRMASRAGTDDVTADATEGDATDATQDADANPAADARRAASGADDRLTTGCDKCRP